MFHFTRRTIVTAAVLTIAALIAPHATAANTVWNQGFETDTSGWFHEDNGWSGTVDRTASGGGSLALSSAGGTFHAEYTQTDAAGGLTGPFSRFDMYRDTWPNGFTARVDVYLDTGWSAGEGFDYSVAVNGSDDTHLQDFIFHVTQDTSSGQLLVAGSNNTNFDPREDLETINHHTVASSGWYTLEHAFHAVGDGTFAANMNLRDAADTILFTETRTVAEAGSPATASQIGGNRYAWFTNIDIAGGIGVDNHQLITGTAIPTPAALPAGLALMGLLTLRRRR